MTSSQEIARRTMGSELALPAGARALGSRVKPIIRLGMGIQDPEREFPIKTDYLTVRGDERAVAKFQRIYGEQPKAVKIMVPSSLELALDISYRSFVGGQGDGGGRPLALGFTNFAPLGYVGGPDMLRVWKQDGTYAEVETLGLDETGQPLDEIARELNIEVHATFTFTIPEVLGWGSFAQVTSKGKKSADNLTFKLSEIYSAFGAKAPWAFNRDEPPLLVLKPDTAMTKFTDKKSGESKWGKTKIFVLDIVIPEAFHDMQDRLLDHQRELAPHGAAAAMYGGGQTITHELPAADPPLADGGTVGAASQADGAGEAISPETAAEAAPSAPGTDDEPSLADEPQSPFTAPAGVDDDSINIAAQHAALFHPPNGAHKEMTLGEILAVGPKGESWFRNRLEVVTEPPEYVSALWNFCRVYAPELFQAALAKREAEAA